MPGKISFPGGIKCLICAVDFYGGRRVGYRLCQGSFGPCTNQEYSSSMGIVENHEKLRKTPIATFKNSKQNGNFSENFFDIQKDGGSSEGNFPSSADIVSFQIPSVVVRECIYFCRIRLGR